MSDALDGNVLAGVFSEVFAVEATTGRAECVGCGQVNVVAETLVYQSAPGMVARCPGCQAVVFRVVRGPDRIWLDLRGVVCLELEV